MASLWDVVPAPITPALNQNVKCEGCVVGAGIAGFTTAYLLLREKKSVVVLEARELGRAQTGLTSAHLSNALDDRYYILEKFHGGSGIKLAAHSHSAAIDKIEPIARNEKIASEFKRVSGYLFSHGRAAQMELAKEREAAYRSFIIGMKIKKELAHQSLHWDTDEPYHYIRLHDIKDDPKNEILIIGGEDH